jgi:hypothetical protein
VLPSFTAAIVCTAAAAAAAVLSLRYLYKLQPSRYKELLLNGSLGQLWQLRAHTLPGLTETLQLGDTVKQRQAVAALQTHFSNSNSSSEG